MRRLAPVFLLLAACASTTPTPTPAASAAAPCNPGHSILNATLYVQSSAEYRAAAMQTFAAARKALDEALADPTRVGATEETNDDPSQPPAIIVDADETVLDNTAFEARVIQKGITYDEALWKQWTSEGAATAIPGAAELLAYAKSRGVTVFYVTNRDEDERAGTMANLRRLGYPLEANVETLLLRENKVSDKSPRRKQVADKYRVLLLAGDDLNDFANVRRAPWQEREDLITKTKDWWGTRWFMLPNPMYGSWEHAAIGSGGTPCEQLERKIRALKP
ncbi:MAG: 5'-nucleotidase, lipoprotein e(P4) family [Thermoanaerobaculia bacterium]